MAKVELHELAHSRTGEKGDIVNLAIFTFDYADYDLIAKQVTTDRVRERYKGLVKGKIERYEMPKVAALNFVLHGALGGGRSRTLAFDESGKALASAILDIKIDVPSSHPLLRGRLREAPESAMIAEKRNINLRNKQAKKVIRIGMGSGWARDRIDAASEMAKNSALHYICFDTMSEVTMSALHVQKEANAKMKAYDLYLEERIGGVLPHCIANKTRIISNGGWLDPIGAQKQIIEIAKNLNLPPIKVSAIIGGDLTNAMGKSDYTFLENGEPVSMYKDRIVSAEVYLGVEEICQALEEGADVILGPRIADSALVLAPLVHEFGWKPTDWNSLGAGSMIGHLLECGTQITGGYFADPGYKDVPDIENLGLPIGEVEESGEAVITKVQGSGGIVCMGTCREQLLYEVADPSNYLLPDVTADFSEVEFTQIATNRVRVVGGRGKPKPDTLKCLIGVREGYQAEEMICYAGPNALDRAKLAKMIIEKRFAKTGIKYKEIRIDFIGINAVHREASPEPTLPPYEVVVRVAVKTESEDEARSVRKEIDPMAVNGPASTGKWSPIGDRVRPVIGLYSALVPRSDIRTEVVTLSS